jgi:2'-5' RNA ligase
MRGTMRLFIALNLPERERLAMHQAVAPVRAAVPGASWVRAENLHVTLKFLGEVEDGRAEALREALDGAARRSRPLALSLGGVGAFPNLRAPRIVWMGAAPDARLELLYDDVERACDALGFPVEGRAFRPHVTLGRVRERASGGDARALSSAARAVRYVGAVDVETVDLMRSTLAAGGSRYELLHAARLGDG